MRIARKDIFLLVFVAAIWGGNFAVIKAGLVSIPPLALSSVRFIFAAFPACILVRPPDVPLWKLLAVGSSLGILMSAFQFAGMKAGVNVSISSIVLQSQALFTVLMAIIMLGEKPTRNKVLSIQFGIFGLFLFLSVYWDGEVIGGLLMVIVAAFFWAVSNILIRGMKEVSIISLMVWMSFVPIIPLALLSMLFEADEYQIVENLLSLDGLFISLYLGIGVIVIGYGIWGRMIQKYEVSQIAPFSLLVPVFGIFFGVLFFGDELGLLEFVGVALIFTSVIFAVVPEGKKTPA